MRIVPLAIASRPSAAMEGELYLALISWTCIRSETHLTVHGIDTLLAVRRLRIRVPDTGRMLLVIDRSTRIELRGAAIGSAQRQWQSIRILMRRGGRARLRRVAGDVLPPLRGGPIRAFGPIRKAHAPHAALRRGGGMLRAMRPAGHRPAIRSAAFRRGARALAVAPPRAIAKVAVSARQRRHAASFSARPADPQRGHHSP